MSKIVKRGKEPPHYAPPPGIPFQCSQCGAELETVEDEQAFKPAVLEGEPGTPWKRGWRIPCPCCAHNIFVEEPGSD